MRRRGVMAPFSTGAGIVIALEGDPWAEELARLFAPLGYQVTIGSDFAGALELSRKRVLDIAFVMIGPSIDEAAYLALARALKLDPSTAVLPLVRGVEGGGRGERPGSVTIVPDDTFDSVAAGVGIVREEAERWREDRRHLRRQVTLRSPSDGGSVEELKAIFEQSYSGALADETESYKTLSAFREAIDNAAMHGNRGLASKRLTVTLTQDDRRIALDVKDEGTGFDYKKLLEETRVSGTAEHARARLERGEAGGLGIKMMADCVDEVHYLEGGTRVTLVRRRGKGATSRGA